MKKQSKTIGLVAHDNRKRDLIEWVFIISSPLLSQPYTPIVKDYSVHVERNVKIE